MRTFTLPVAAPTLCDMDVYRIRWLNFRDLAGHRGGITEAAGKLGKSQGQVSHFGGERPIKNIGHDIAREIESAYGKPHGWLDQIHSLNDSEKSGEIHTAVTGEQSQPVRYSPEIVAVAWDWVRFEEGPFDSRGRQPFAYPSDLARAKRLLELCDLIQADGGTLTAQHSQELIDAATTRQQQGNGKHGKHSRARGASTR